MISITHKQSPSPPTINEVDYDKNPTKLYLSIITSDWSSVISELSSSPLSARIWVSRHNNNNNDTSDKSFISNDDDSNALSIPPPPSHLRWRFLPLHSACARHPPPYVISALLASYPEAAREVDDMGMLPLHYACGNRACAEVIHMLLVAYPDGIGRPSALDGKLPLHFVSLWGARSLEVVNLMLTVFPESVGVEDHDGKTPLDYSEDDEVLELMRRCACMMGCPSATFRVLRTHGKTLAAAAAAKSNKDDSTATIEELHHTITNLREENASFREMTLMLSEENDNLRVERDENHREFTAKLEQIEHRLSEKDKQWSNLKNEKMALQGAIATIHAEKIAMKAERDQVGRRCAGLVEEMAAVKEEYEAYLKETEGLVTKMKKMKKRKEERRRRVGALLDTISMSLSELVEINCDADGSTEVRSVVSVEMETEEEKEEEKEEKDVDVTNFEGAEIMMSRMEDDVEEVVVTTPMSNEVMVVSDIEKTEDENDSYEPILNNDTITTITPEIAFANIIHDNDDYPKKPMKKYDLNPRTTAAWFNNTSVVVNSVQTTTTSMASIKEEIDVAVLDALTNFKTNDFVAATTTPIINRDDTIIVTNTKEEVVDDEVVEDEEEPIDADDNEDQQEQQPIESTISTVKSTTTTTTIDDSSNKTNDNDETKQSSPRFSSRHWIYPDEDDLIKNSNSSSDDIMAELQMKSTAPRFSCLSWIKPDETPSSILPTVDTEEGNNNDNVVVDGNMVEEESSSTNASINNNNKNDYDVREEPPSLLLHDDDMIMEDYDEKRESNSVQEEKTTTMTMDAEQQMISSSSKKDNTNDDCSRDCVVISDDDDIITEHQQQTQQQSEDDDDDEEMIIASTTATTTSEEVNNNMNYDVCDDEERLKRLEDEKAKLRQVFGDLCRKLNSYNKKMTTTSSSSDDNDEEEEKGGDRYYKL